MERGECFIMAIGLLGKKVGMTQIFAEDGNPVPVTVIKAGPCYVVDKRRNERGEVQAIQIGFEDKKPRRTNKPMKGHFARAEVKPQKHLWDIRVDNLDDYGLGQELKVDIFQVGDKVSITGRSKGKGFAGVVKRHNFRGGPASHGSTRHRRPGSIGASSSPSRVFKGMRMGGRMGGEKVTVQGLEVIKIDPANNLLLVKGAVPGANRGLLFIKK